MLEHNPDYNINYFSILLDVLQEQEDRSHFKWEQLRGQEENDNRIEFQIRVPKVIQVNLYEKKEKKGDRSDFWGDILLSGLWVKKHPIAKFHGPFKETFNPGLEFQITKEYFTTFFHRQGREPEDFDNEASAEYMLQSFRESMFKLFHKSCLGRPQYPSTHEAFNHLLSSYQKGGSIRACRDAVYDSFGPKVLPLNKT